MDTKEIDEKIISVCREMGKDDQDLLVLLLFIYFEFGASSLAAYADTKS